MSFCSKCGTQMKDNASFCPSCGAAVVNGKAALKSTAGNGKQPRGKVSDKKIAIIACTLVVVVLVIFLLVKLFGGYKRPIRLLVKAMNDASCELEDYTDSTNKVFANLIDDALDLVDDIDDDIKDDLDDALEDTFEDAYDNLEYAYGKKIKITYEIEDEEKIGKEELKGFEDNLSEISKVIADEELSDADELMDMVEGVLNMYGMEDAFEDIVTKKNIKKVAKFLKSVEKEFGKVDVDAGYIITLDVEVKGRDGDEKFRDVTLMVLKVNGKWGIEPSSLLNFMDTVIGLDAEDVAEDILYSVVADMMG